MHIILHNFRGGGGGYANRCAVHMRDQKAAKKKKKKKGCLFRLNTIPVNHD